MAYMVISADTCPETATFGKSLASAPYSNYRRIVDAITVNAILVFSLLLMLGFNKALAETLPYYEPGINPYREQASQDGIESVDPYTGMLKVQHLDLFLPGNGGLDIKVLRTYDSADVIQLGVGGGHTSPLGNGWVFHFGLFSGYNVCNLNSILGTIRPTFKLPDGTQFRFNKAQPGFGHLYVSREGWVADCASDGNGLLVVSPDGVRYELTVQGVLGAVIGAKIYYVKKITDRNGNWLNFDYQITDNKAYVSKITANDGRLA